MTDPCPMCTRLRVAVALLAFCSVGLLGMILLISHQHRLELRPFLPSHLRQP